MQTLVYASEEERTKGLKERVEINLKDHVFRLLERHSDKRVVTRQLLK